MVFKFGKYFRKFFPFVLGSFAAGAVNGLFGMGGGILIFFMLCKLYAENEEYSTKDIFAMTVMSVLLMSLSSVCLYFTSGAFSVEDVLPYILPAVLGGIGGAFALSYIKTSILRKIFAAIMIYGGISLILRK